MSSGVFRAGRGVRACASLTGAHALAGEVSYAGGAVFKHLVDLADAGLAVTASRIAGAILALDRFTADALS